MAMTFDDYRDAIKEDVKNWLDEVEWPTHKDRWPTAIPGTPEYDEQRDEIYDRLYNSDPVTGNASGSYTFNSYQAADNVSQLIWDEDLWDLIGEAEPALKRGPEYIDVAIRCALLSECLDAVLEDHELSEDEESDE